MLIFGYTPLAVALSAIFGLSVAVSASNLHEYSHYLFARVETKDVEIQRKYILLAHRVNFYSPKQLSKNWCRITGISPAITGTVLLVSTLSIDLSNPLIEYFLIGTAAGGFILSPSDLLATLYPEEYIDRADRNGDFGHLKLTRYMLDRLRG